MAGEAIKPAPIWERPHEAKRDRLNLELNLRWMLARQRSGRSDPRARVGVYAEAGAWHVGARSIARPFGKGEIILTGVHFERPSPAADSARAATPQVLCTETSVAQFYERNVDPVQSLDP